MIPNKLTLCTGDMLQDDGILVIPVNCVPGVMGAGLAKAFADSCEGARHWHRLQVGRGNLAIGKPHITSMIHRCPIVYFPTKNHWKNPSQLSWIIDGLASLTTELTDNYKLWGFYWKTISMPALGCGLGGLKFPLVRNVIEEFTASLPDQYRVRLYEPK